MTFNTGTTFQKEVNQSPTNGRLNVRTPEARYETGSLPDTAALAQTQSNFKESCASSFNFNQALRKGRPAIVSLRLENRPDFKPTEPVARY